MAERASALAHLPSVGFTGGAVTLRDVRPGFILQIAAWPDHAGAVEAAIGNLLGAPAPRLGTATTNQELTVAALAPGRFLIAGPAPELAARLEAAIAAKDGAATDLSHGRVILRLEGEAAASVLAKVVALDVDPSVFPPGRVAQTTAHHIDVVVHRLGEASFDLWVLRSFAESLAEWLLDAGV